MCGFKMIEFVKEGKLSKAAAPCLEKVIAPFVKS